MSADLRRLIAARALFVFAVQMQAVTVAWQVWAITHDPLFLGLVGLAEALPALGLALHAGLIVDRGDPQTIYRCVLWLSFVSAVALVLLHLPNQVIDVGGHVVTLYIASVFTGVARAFSQPAMFALVPRTVRRTELGTAAAWMSASMQVARVAGPAVGGLIYGWFGMLTTASCVCALLLLAQALLRRIRMQHSKQGASGLVSSRRDALLEGVRFVFGHPLLLPALTLDMISVLFGGVTAVLPIFADQVLQVGPNGLGLLRAAPAVGAAVGSIALTRLPLRAHAGAWLLASLTGFGACILAFALSRNVILSAVVLCLSGLFDSVSVLVRTLVVQLSSPEALRGRIAAVNAMFIGSSNELGELESGVAAKLMGTVPSVMFGGCMCLLTVAVVAVLSRPLRRLNLAAL